MTQVQENRTIFQWKQGRRGGSIALHGFHIEELCLQTLTSLCYLHNFKLSTFASPVFTPYPVMRILVFQYAKLLSDCIWAIAKAKHRVNPFL